MITVYQLYPSRGVNLKKWLSCLALFFIAHPLDSYAAPEDRGEMGSLIGVTAGGFLGAGTGGEGERQPTQLGGSVHLVLGEEVLPRLTVGVGIDSYFGQRQGEGDTRSQVFGFGFEGRYRFTDASRGLFVLTGIGIGAGGFINSGESFSGAEGSGGGSIWKVGVGYELGGEEVSGFTYTPRLTFQRLGAQGESEVSINLVSLGVEILYAGGR
jgi:hypothetical protein